MAIEWTKGRKIAVSSLAVIAAWATALMVSLPAIAAPAQGRRVIHVSSVGELYVAVNDPDNAGVRIVMAPGIYFLDPTQPTGGRLELQQDMEIIGHAGDASAVVIDAAN